MSAAVAGAPATLAARMGIEVIEEAPERVVARMPVEINRQPFGVLAGGASAMLAESTASRAAVLHAARSEQGAVGVQISAIHHSSVRSGFVEATASAVHLGRSTASYEVVIATPEGRRVCTATVLCMIVDRPAGS